MTRRRPPSKREQAEALWPLVARIAACLMGLWMLYYGTAVLHGSSAAVLLVGVGLTGVPIAPIVAEMLDRLPGGKEE